MAIAKRLSWPAIQLEYTAEVGQTFTRFNWTDPVDGTAQTSTSTLLEFDARFPTVVTMVRVSGNTTIYLVAPERGLSTSQIRMKNGRRMRAYETDERTYTPVRPSGVIWNLSNSSPWYVNDSLGIELHSTQITRNKDVVIKIDDVQVLSFSFLQDLGGPSSYCFENPICLESYDGVLHCMAMIRPALIPPTTSTSFNPNYRHVTSRDNGATWAPNGTQMWLSADVRSADVIELADKSLATVAVLSNGTTRRLMFKRATPTWSGTTYSTVWPDDASARVVLASIDRVEAWTIWQEDSGFIFVSNGRNKMLMTTEINPQNAAAWTEVPFTFVEGDA